MSSLTGIKVQNTGQTPLTWVLYRLSPTATPHNLLATPILRAGVLPGRPFHWVALPEAEIVSVTGQDLVSTVLPECLVSFYWGMERRRAMSNLGEEFPKQQERLRTLLGYGMEIGPQGAFYCAMIRDILRRADKAAMEQDLPAMIRIYQEMVEVKE